MKWPPNYGAFLEKIHHLWSMTGFPDGKRVTQILLLVVVYFGTAQLGFTFAPGEQVTVIWPAAGVALAALLLFGYRVWPGILLGSFLSKLSVDLPVWMSLSIAISNTVEPLLGVWLLRRYVHVNRYLEHLKGVIGLWFFSSFISTLLGALIGVTTVWLSGLQPEAAYGAMFLTWWLADAGGSLLVTPLLLAWGSGRYFMPRPKVIFEAASLLVISIISCIIIFIHPSIMGDIWVYPYMVFPLVIWAAISFGQRGITLLTLGIANISLSATLYNIGPFADMPLFQGLIVAQTFVMIVAMIGLTVCAALSELRVAEAQVRDSLQYLQNVIDHIPDAIFMKNRLNILIGGNRAMWALLNGPPEKFIGMNCDDVFTKEEELREFTRKYERVFDTGVTEASEEIFTDQESNRHVLFFKVARYYDGKGEPFLVAVARDITTIKETEARLIRYTHELERSNSELDDFAYIASHDLKEPLRGLQSFSQFLLEDYEDKLDKEGKAKLHTISDLAKRLDSLLNALLHFSRLGRTKLAIGQTDMQEVVGKCISMLSINLKEKNTTVEILQKLPAIRCDCIRVGEVFQNLISNAVKYSDNKDNKIEIGCVKDHPRAKGQIAFFVRDHGIGIPEKHLETVFKIFKRLHAREAYGGGTGSGLAICKKIITQHGGDIWAESKGEGQGTTVYFTLPQ